MNGVPAKAGSALRSYAIGGSMAAALHRRIIFFNVHEPGIAPSRLKPGLQFLTTHLHELRGGLNPRPFSPAAAWKRLSSGPHFRLRRKWGPENRKSTALPHSAPLRACPEHSRRGKLRRKPSGNGQSRKSCHLQDLRGGNMDRETKRFKRPRIEPRMRPRKCILHARISRAITYK